MIICCRETFICIFNMVIIKKNKPYPMIIFFNLVITYTLYPRLSVAKKNFGGLGLDQHSYGYDV